MDKSISGNLGVSTGSIGTSLGLSYGSFHIFGLLLAKFLQFNRCNRQNDSKQSNNCSGESRNQSVVGVEKFKPQANTFHDLIPYLLVPAFIACVIGIPALIFWYFMHWR